MTVPPLPPVMIEPLVRAALLEDLGRAGDITSDAIVPAEAVARVALVARQAGVVSRAREALAIALRTLDAGDALDLVVPELQRRGLFRLGRLVRRARDAGVNFGRSPQRLDGLAMCRGL